MAITLTSRKAPRKQLEELLSQVPAFVETYDHETKDFGRRSPVGMVHSDGTRTQFPGYANEHHGYLVTLLWRRDDGQETEDALDDLSRDVRQKLIDNTTVAGIWDDLLFDDDFSSLDYPTIDNVQYRRERLRVLVHVVGDS